MKLNRPAKLSVVIGTRPEAIKMAPVIIELSKRPSFSVTVLATGQHTDMLNQALDYFGLSSDINLSIMRERQTLDHITSSVLTGVGEVFDREQPDAVLVHGDTTTTMAAALAAFYRGIPAAHVEAGLRSFDLKKPFPEELNRVVTDKISRWLFAPTKWAQDNLLRDGAAPENIHVTGNTVVDALYMTIKNSDRPSESALQELAGKPFILLTAHRRESWGKPLENICAAVDKILACNPGYRVVIPMHKNPTVRDTIDRFFSGNESVLLTEPLNYPDFVWALDRCRIILSDSGGVQEEASSIGKPVLVLRDLTERPEAVSEGSCILVGTDTEKIVTNANRLLSNPDEYDRLAARKETNPFGDGMSAARIADILERDL